MKKQTCISCTFYNAYYMQFGGSFKKTYNGYCSRSNKIRTKSDSCTDHINNCIREERTEKLRLKNLDKALKSINDIADILKEKESD